MVEMLWQPDGQWWERQGYVIFLHPSMDPNVPEVETGWVRVTEERARELLTRRKEVSSWATNEYERQWTDLFPGSVNGSTP